MRKSLALVALFPVFIYAIRAHAADDQLFAVKVGGKYGYIDRTGKLVIQPQFEKVGHFQDGLAIAKSGERCGYIDTSGKFAIPPVFEDCGGLSEGLARVKRDGKWGFLDASGKTVIPPRYDDAWNFSEGLASVKLRDKYGYIDKTGQMVISPSFKFAYPFSEGLASVMSGKWFGYIDSKGNEVIPANLYWADSFQDGLAGVFWPSGGGGFIDSAGNAVVDLGPIQTLYKLHFLTDTLQHAKSYRFSEGLAAFLHQGTWGYVDKDGNRVIRPAYAFVRPFSEGLAAVAIAPKHPQIYVFDVFVTPDDRMIARSARQKGGLVPHVPPDAPLLPWGYIDHAGKLVIPANFDSADDFSGGLARVSLADGSDGYIDKTGKYVWQPSK
jgi:hypothetical protein